MALKRCFKKPHFHQHVWGFLFKGHFFFFFFFPKLWFVRELQIWIKER